MFIMKIVKKGHKELAFLLIFKIIEIQQKHVFTYMKQLRNFEVFVKIKNSPKIHNPLT